MPEPNVYLDKDDLESLEALIEFQQGGGLRHIFELTTVLTSLSDSVKKMEDADKKKPKIILP